MSFFVREMRDWAVMSPLSGLELIKKNVNSVWDIPKAIVQMIG